MKARLDLATLDTPSPKYVARIAQYDWGRIAKDLDAYGAAVLPSLLSGVDCLSASNRFSGAVLSRMPPIAEMRAWGNGNYRYLRHATPEMISAAIYPRQATSMLPEHTVGQHTLLHQDISGDFTFPLQVAIVLSQHGADHGGGEFVITEQRPRMQTRAEVVSLNKGAAVVFAASNRPVAGTRGS